MSSNLAEEIATIDRQAKRSGEQARINERAGQIWPLFMTMCGAFGFFGLQNGMAAYLVGAFPFLVSCLAEHINDSQKALTQDRKFLYWQEKEAGCTTGAERYYDLFAEKLTGGNKRAIKRAFVFTSFIATGLLVWHMSLDYLPLISVIAALSFNLFFIGQTIYWLTYWKPYIKWFQNHFHLSNYQEGARHDHR
jgi:hypothetical protein